MESWLDKMKDKPVEVVLAGLEQNKSKVKVLKAVLNGFGHRGVRMRSAELLGVLNTDEAVGAIVEAADGGRISQRHASSVLATMTSPKAFEVMVDIAEGRRWAHASTCFTIVNGALEKSTSASAVFYCWKNQGFSRKLVSRLNDVSNDEIVRWTQSFDVEAQFDLLDPRPVRNYLVKKRKLSSVYSVIDGAQGTLYLLRTGKKADKKRLDEVKDIEYTTFLNALTCRDYYNVFAQNKFLVDYFQSRSLNSLLTLGEEKERGKKTGVRKSKVEGGFENLAEILHMEESLLCQLYGQWERFDEEFYQEFSIPKKNGGDRTIHAPVAFLKAIQRHIKENILDEHPLSGSAHGFVKGKSIVTNAKTHVGQRVVINLDLEDFFPSINEWRVHGLFRSLGYTPKEARLLTILTVYQQELPQGAPTSPGIANLICRKLDRRLLGLAKKAGAAYTRYADDMTFSGPESIIGILPVVKNIIKEEGFVIAQEKLRIQRRGRRQEVTGLTVNERTSIPRNIRKRLRAAVHHMKCDGYAEWKGVPLTSYSLAGHLAFLNSVHPEQAASMKGELHRKRSRKHDLPT